MLFIVLPELELYNLTSWSKNQYTLPYIDLHRYHDKNVYTKLKEQAWDKVCTFDLENTHLCLVWNMGILLLLPGEERDDI